MILHVNIWAVHKLERTEAALYSRRQTNVSKQARDVAGSLSKYPGSEKQETKRHYFSFFQEREQRHLCSARADNNLSIDSDSEYHERERTAVSGLGKAFHHPNASHSHL